MGLILILSTLIAIYLLGLFIASEIEKFLSEDDDNEDEAKNIAIQDILEDEPINYINYDKTFKELNL